MATVYYNRAAAVAYARQFTTNNSGTSTYNTDGFNTVPNNQDCANYVSQCLFAGGIPQNSGWYYRTPYTSSGSRTTAWTGTVSLRNSLVSRGWATKLSSRNGLRKGDLVFTYESETSLPHVVFVVEDVNSSTADIIICGHTSNQLDKIRNNSLSSVYYHISDYNTLASDDRQFVGYTGALDFSTAMSDYGKVNLSNGSNNTYVSNLKRRLLHLGFYFGTVNNAFDNATETSVRAFQNAKRITSDGIVGPTTRKKLYHPA